MRRFRAYLVDDEPLAVKRLARLLGATGRFEITGSTNDPREAAAFLSSQAVDVLFLDIRMPGLDGFELLAGVPEQPMVVFTTAFDEYALKAFDVNSIDYLLKPIEPEQLDRVIQKLETFRAAPEPASRYLDRIACHFGSRLQIVPIEEITHFFARDKLVWAAAGGRALAVDYSIAELEQKLDPQRFLRIHRATLLNLEWLDEVAPWFAGGLAVRVKDPAGTQLQVSRDRVRVLKERLGF
jgi:two-component system LytT family response regulator